MTKTLTSEPGDGIKRRPPVPNVVRWSRDADGAVRRDWYPGFVSKQPGRVPEGWAAEGSPEEAAQKEAAEAAVPEGAFVRRMSTLPAPGPRQPETEAERRKHLMEPEHGVLDYLANEKWPAEDEGREYRDWDTWRTAQPWAAEADALIAAEAAAAKTPEPETMMPPPPARRPPPSRQVRRSS